MKRSLLVLFAAGLLPLALLAIILSVARGAAAQTLIEGTRAAPQTVQAPSIVVTMTVGTNPAVCATTDSVTLPIGGGSVIYCYQVGNTGDINLTRHDLVDSELGAILTDFPYILVPGASAFITQSAAIAATTASVADWTAYNPGPINVAEASDGATVYVTEVRPSIAITMTVGTDPSECATTDSVHLPVGGGSVTYCYQVGNTGNINLTRHDLVDSELGTILTDFPYILAPGASAFITQSAMITTTTASVADWTAYNPGPINVAEASDGATVLVGHLVNLPVIWRE